MDILYHRIADELVHQITGGVYQTGERLPGVRKLAQQWHISVATAVSAYERLSDLGYAEPRPRSGYYVKARHTAPPAMPTINLETSAPSPVNGQSLAMALIKAANDPSIIQLGAAVPDASFLPTQAISRAFTTVMRTRRGQTAQYQMPPGSAELRRQIAKRMGELGCSVPVDDIVITTGCQEALSLALQAVTQRGDVVAVESPAFYGLLHVLESLGLEALEIPAHPVDGVSLDALAFALERWPVKACVFSPNFSNPMGYCMSDEQKRALVTLLGQHKVTLIEDDVYGDLGHNHRRPSICKGLMPTADIIYCSSFSKSLAPGLRVGWVVTHGPRREQIEYLKYVSSIASSTVPQMAVAELLASGRYERYLREVRGRYASAVARMTERVLTLFPEGTRLSQPVGGFVIWVELPPGTSGTALAQQALHEGINVAPGVLFSASGKFENCIRLSCACAWDARVERALLTLAKLL